MKKLVLERYHQILQDRIDVFRDMISGLTEDAQNDAKGSAGLRFTLTQPWSLLLMNDERMIHESTPIQPLQADSQAACRDTLVVTLRSGGFPGEGHAQVA